MSFLLDIRQPNTYRLLSAKIKGSSENSSDLGQIVNWKLSVLASSNSSLVLSWCCQTVTTSTCTESQIQIFEFGAVWLHRKTEIW